MRYRRQSECARIAYSERRTMGCDGCTDGDARLLTADPSGRPGPDRVCPNPERRWWPFGHSRAECRSQSSLKAMNAQKPVRLLVRRLRRVRNQIQRPASGGFHIPVIGDQSLTSAAQRFLRKPYRSDVPVTRIPFGRGAALDGQLPARLLRRRYLQGV